MGSCLVAIQWDTQDLCISLCVDFNLKRKKIVNKLNCSYDKHAEVWG